MFVYKLGDFKVLSDLELKANKEFLRLYNNEIELFLYYPKRVFFKVEDSYGITNLENTVQFKETISTWDKNYTLKYKEKTQTFEIKVKEKENHIPPKCRL